MLRKSQARKSGRPLKTVMGKSARLALLILVVSFLIDGNAGQIVPYGVRSKCYKVVAKAAKGSSANSFCSGEAPSEVNVCARNIDDANSRVSAAELEVRSLNAAYCNKQSQEFCKSLGMTQGVCPPTGVRCNMPFRNECIEDADCKAPVYVCCATCEAEAAAFQCEGLTPRLIDALCQVSFHSFYLVLSMNTETPLRKSENAEF